MRLVGLLYGLAQIFCTEALWFSPLCCFFLFLMCRDSIPAPRLACPYDGRHQLERLHFEASLQQAGGKEKEGRDDQNGRLSRNDCGGGWMGTLRSISLCVSPSSFTDPLSRKMGHHLSDLWGENVKNSRREKKKLYLRRRDVEKESVIVDTKPIRFVGFCV